MRQVADPEIKKRFAFDNPWWETGVVEERFRAMPRRAYFDSFLRLIGDRKVHRAVVLMGPRRVGKSVMIQQAVQRLLDEHVPARSILYLSADTPVYTGLALETLLGHFQAIHGHGRDAALHVFFDEIQYHKDWELHLKSLVDSYPAIRFVASGSAAAALKLKSTESGAGRFTDFVLPPLTFPEFLRFRGKEALIDDDYHRATDIAALNTEFIDYLNFGGFPEAVMEERVRTEMNRYVAHDIIDKVLLRDLPSLYGIADVQELNRLFAVLAYNTGDEISIDDLSKSSNVAKNTLKKYLEYLEAAFLICRIYRIDQTARRFKKQTHFKVYLTNPSIRAALFGNVVDGNEAMGRLAETALVSQVAQSQAINEMHYARWRGGEVDLVWMAPRNPCPFMTIEVKWSDRPVRYPESELKALAEFFRKAGPMSECRVSTKTVRARQYLQGVQIDFVPTAELCWEFATIFVDMELADGLHPWTLARFAERSPRGPG